MRPDGSTDFQTLQNAFRDGRVDELHYYVFDLIYLDGYSLKDAPLEERKRILADLLPPERKTNKVHYSDHVRGTGTEFANQACK